MLENEKRKNVRYQTIARVCIPGVLEGDALLKDISITGCSIESTAFADIQTNTPYMLEVKPEAASKIAKFELSVEVRWLKTSGDSYEAGFMVTASPKGKQFERYVDYLAWRSATK
jgi:hypothetical protein